MLTKEKIRAQQIVIELPTEEAVNWIRVALQRVVKDDHGNTLQVNDRIGFINHALPEVALQMVNFVDPVTGKELEISIAGLATGIKALVLNWLVSEYNCTINENGDAIKE